MAADREDRTAAARVELEATTTEEDERPESTVTDLERAEGVEPRPPLLVLELHPRLPLTEAELGTAEGTEARLRPSELELGEEEQSRLELLAVVGVVEVVEVERMEAEGAEDRPARSALELGMVEGAASRRVRLELELGTVEEGAARRRVLLDLCWRREAPSSRGTVGARLASRPRQLRVARTQRTSLSPLLV